MQLLRILATLATLASLLSGATARADALLFVSTSPVPPGKFQKLAEIGAAQGFRVEHRQAEKLPLEQDASVFKGFDAVFFDAPRDHLQELVRSRLARALPGLSAPQLWLHDKGPQAKGFPQPLAERLHAYYINGGRPNFENFFRTLAADRKQQPFDRIAAPIVFPKEAIYHPQAPGLVFADPAAYLKWQGIDRSKRPPVIAIALHQTYIASEQTAFIDDLIARIEAGGAVALPYYGPVMGPQAAMLRVDGQLVADAVINTQIVLDPEGRRKELAALGIPVVQALSYRKGDEADWRADPQGVPLTDVPFFLAQGEYAGIVDAIVAGSTRKGDEQVAVIAEQAAAIVGKALRLVRLQRLPNAEKKVAVLFWNYPPGEKNLSASYLNLPRSLAATLRALNAAGYDARPEDEAVLINSLQRLLAPAYREDTRSQLEALLRDGLAEKLPVATYRAWFAGLPEGVRREMGERWGDPEKSAMVVKQNGVAYFVIPRFAAGKVIFTPQAPRGERWEEKEKALYHSVKASPSHYYLAHYLWARETFKADALVHYGTHGTQEWLPGKERGLSVNDYPLLAVGDVPVIYPYIVDNIGEALQAKRRGRTWKGKADGDRKLAALYLSRMQFAYGSDESAWGTSFGKSGIAGVIAGVDTGATGQAASINLYAEHLKGTEGAVLSRTSNLYGMLTTDDPFQYLGGIGLAVRSLDGKAPELYISNLRGGGTGNSGSGKIEGADQFLARELATRNFHPGYIKGLIAEGYAGTLQVLDSMNNFWGWSAVAREIVRDDQWQEFVDVYVRDKHRLGLQDWFESKNPHALAQTMERMLEAARQGYWQADARTLAELKERYRDLARRHDVRTDNQAFNDFVAPAPGFGRLAPTAVAPIVAPPPVQGMLLERVDDRQPPAPPFVALGLALLLLATLGGMAHALANEKHQDKRKDKRQDEA